MAAAVLCLLANPIALQSDRRITPIADGDQHGFVRQPQQALAEMLTADFVGRHFKNDPPVFESVAV